LAGAILDANRRRRILMSGGIICGVDDSESAKGAARIARALSSELGLDVIFVRVVEPGAPDAKVSAMAERLQQLSASRSDVDCGAAWFVDAGHPADGLVAAAKRARASLIVVGSTGPHSSLLGSVSADVSRRAPCPVVVVSPGADAAVNGDGDSDDFDGRAKEFFGGIARFGLGGTETVSAGGIARLGLGSDDKRDD
jgi:nucleotide-binding universal stress UspA family protein